MEQEYVDITKETQLTAEQIEYVKTNPEGLTLEGAKEHFFNWKKSNNKYQKKMYEAMVKNCKKFTPSGTTVSGEIILAKRDGKITWSKKKNIE